jgi:hypothetical protein
MSEPANPDSSAEDPGSHPRSDDERRRALLNPALGFSLLDCRGKAAPPGQALIHTWLDNWKGIGHVAVGMAHQGYDISLTRYPHGWSAKSYVTGIAHSLTSSTGSAWEETPWRAVQRAAWEALQASP